MPKRFTYNWLVWVPFIGIVAMIYFTEFFTIERYCFAGEAWPFIQMFYGILLMTFFMIVFP